MKTRFILCTFAILAVAAFGSPVLAQTDGGFDYGFGVGGFIDENGDGFNDLAPDADGDGIPNGLDPDYAPPLDGTGNQFGPGEGNGGCDGEGFMQRDGFKWKHAIGTSGYGPGDGTGNDREGPGDGTGFGPGDGTCIQIPIDCGEGPNGHVVRR
jgi:hypothetical protein